MTADLALEGQATLMHYGKLMLIEGIVHGDLSEFNVLVDDYGPVIIDLPQAVDAAANNHAYSMLQRDVENITDYYAQFAPQLSRSRYAQEMWAMYEEGTLHADTPLTGEFVEDETSADVDAVLLEIKAALAEEAAKQARIASADQDPSAADNEKPEWEDQ